MRWFAHFKGWTTAVPLTAGTMIVATDTGIAGTWPSVAAESLNSRPGLRLLDSLFFILPL